MINTSHKTQRQKSLAFIWLSLLLAFVISAPSFDGLLKTANHGHETAYAETHTHDASVGYESSCDDGSGLHCGANIMAAADGVSPAVFKLRPLFAPIGLLWLLSIDIAQELPPPRL